jgi:protein farnesyltransferase/geranylgeranyltransferase type-1 subunit alpha
LLLTEISPQSPSKEIDYIHDSLIPDPKNYHTWAYLHWLYSHFSSLGRISEADWDREVRWCEEMLRTDGRNNSAWGWRWFLMISRPGGKGNQDGGKGEITYVPLDDGVGPTFNTTSYALKAIHLIPHNVSAWNYLRG